MLNKKILTGMLIIIVSGLLLGGVIGYIATNSIMKNIVLTEMIEEGYVITKDATATESDIVNGKNAYVDGKLVEGNIEIPNTSGATATSDVILKGKTAYVNGKLVVGTLPYYSGKTTITASTEAYTIEAGTYLASKIIIKGNSNLVSKNIKKGVTIFGVTGTYSTLGE